MYFCSHETSIRVSALSSPETPGSGCTFPRISSTERCAQHGRRLRHRHTLPGCCECRRHLDILLAARPQRALRVRSARRDNMQNGYSRHQGVEKHNLREELAVMHAISSTGLRRVKGLGTTVRCEAASCRARHLNFVSRLTTNGAATPSTLRVSAPSRSAGHQSMGNKHLHTV
ncbi:uncharacterized protein CC84DRAFT_280732 [Paraphaeosphaeria sporulosa]|uniref:Uncharacterized protein n=1 Tax=Paraphaeosphaeria sporulosa TaxID=1460663 RepID=A0A177C2Z2_9PLEO|nr:uncharacterized protein CC84DRAFT_280732 [Paraphaeosphaeria sporulosa]OAG01252.1 hypothetical protein CC84DRAFT_280732 [Paraphaeosphaeria sporulosa]